MPVAGAGARDRWITIQELTQTTGTSGFPIESWDTLKQVWAHKKEATGSRFMNQRFVAHQLSEPFDTEWEIPYSADMDPELVNVRKERRLLVRGRAHDIVWAGEIGRRRGIQLRTLAGGLVT